MYNILYLYFVSLRGVPYLAVTNVSYSQRYEQQAEQDGVYLLLSHEIMLNDHCYANHHKKRDMLRVVSSTTFTSRP
jgi:hypothetical protein